MQIGPIHHKGRRRQRTDGQRVVGTRKLNLKDTLIVLAYAGAATRNAASKTGLVHELDRHVLQQMAKLGLAHAVLELAAGIAQAQVLGNRGYQVVHARRGLDVLRGHERHAGVHQHMRADLVLADGDLKDVEQACHNSPLLVLVLLGRRRAE